VTTIITGLCLRHEGCIPVCPVNCIVAGQPVEQWPYSYIDPGACIDCGLCVPACPYNAIWPEAEVPAPLHGDIPANALFFTQGPGYTARDNL
jgi:ferredoxin